MVNKHCVEFTTYLKQNSLMTYNDAYKEYVDNQIKETVRLSSVNTSIFFRKWLLRKEAQLT